MKFCEMRLRKRMRGLGRGLWEYGDEELKLWEECKKIRGDHKKSLNK